jgi:hypothetical protein
LRIYLKDGLINLAIVNIKKNLITNGLDAALKSEYPNAFGCEYLPGKK